MSNRYYAQFRDLGKDYFKTAKDYNGFTYPYILPGGLLLGREHIQITSHPAKFRGWLSYWLNRWSVVDYLLKKAYRNGGLMYHHWERLRVG